MSNLIEERVVGLKFDNSDFEKNTRQSMNTLQKLETSIGQLKNATNTVTLFAASLKANTWDPFARGAEMSIGKLAALTAAITGVSNAASQMYNWITHTINDLSFAQVDQGFKKYEEYTNSIQTIMSATKKEGEDSEVALDRVNDQMERLLWFADETSYGLTDMTSNVGKFTSQGIDLDKSVTAMEGIALWAASAGQNASTAARVMYNMSQSLGSGSVLLRDWMSVENANMATKEFRELAIQAGLASGTLKQVGDEIQTVEKGTVVTANNFRDTLSEKWLNTDTLMKVLTEYGEYSELVRQETLRTGKLTSEVIEEFEENGTAAMYKIGSAALAAGQEARTFSDAINATKDAVSTQFLRIFQSIFGNYLQAKNVWTTLSEELWEVFAGPLDSINKVLDRWNKAGFQTNLMDSLYNSWLAIWGVVEQVKEVFNEVFDINEKNGYIVLRTITKKIETLSKKFIKFVDSVKSSQTIWDNIRTFFEGLKSTLAIFENLGANIINHILKPVGSESKNIIETFTEILAFIGQALINLQELVEYTDLFNGIFTELEGILDNIFSSIVVIVDKVKEVFGKNAGSDVKNVADSIEKVGDAAEKTAQPVKEIGDSINGVIDGITDGLTSALPTLKMIFEFLGGIGTGILKVLSFIGPIFKQIGVWFGNIGTEITNTITEFFNSISIGEALTNSTSLLDFLSTVAERIRAFIELKTGTKTTSLIGGIVDMIVGAIDNLLTRLEPLEKHFLWIKKNLFNDKDIITVLRELTLTVLGVAAAVKVVADLFFTKSTKDIAAQRSHGLLASILGIGDLLDKAQMVLESFNAISTGLKEVFSGLKDYFKQKFIVDMIKAIGVTILEMAAALLIIALVPKDKMAWAAVMFQVIAGTIIGIMVALNKIISIGGQGRIAEYAAFMAAVAVAIISIGASIFLISMSMLVIAKVNSEAPTAIGTIVFLLASILVMITWFLKLSDAGVGNGKEILLSAVAMAIIAKAIQMMAKAIKKLAVIPPESLVMAMLVIDDLMLVMMLMMGASQLTHRGFEGGGDFNQSVITVLAISSSLFIIAKAIEKLSGIDIKKQPKIIGLLITMFAGLGLLAFELMAFSTYTDAGKLMAVNATLIALVLPVLAIAKVFSSLQGLKAGDMLAAAGALTMVVTAISTALLGAALAFSKPAKALLATTMLIALAISLNSLIPVLKTLEQINIWTIVAAVGGLLIAVGSLVAITLIFSKDKSGAIGNNLLKLASALVIIGMSSLMASAGIWLISDAFAKFVDSIVRLTEIGPEGIENFKNVLIAFGEKIPLFLQGVGEGISNMIVAAFANKTAIAGAMASFINAIAITIKQVMPNLKETFKLVMEELLAFLKEFMPKVNSFLYDIVCDLNTYILKMLNEFVPLLNDHLIMVTWDLLIKLLDLLNRFVPLLNAELAKEGMDLIYWVNELLKYLAGTILQGTIDILTMIRDNIGEIIALTVEIANTILFGLIEGLIASVPLLYDKAMELIDTLLELFDKILDSDRWNDMVSKVEKILGKLCEAMNKWVQIESKVNGVLYNVGKNLIAGLAKGLIGAWADSISAPIRFIGNGIVNGFKKIFRIQSPSKVMEQIGGYITKGLGIGMEKGGEGLKTVVTDISSMVKMDFTKNFGSVGDMFSNLGGGLLEGLKTNFSGVDLGGILGNFTNLNPTITPTLDLSKIKSQSMGLNDIFGNNQISAITSSGMFSTPGLGLDTVTQTESMNQLMDKMKDYMDVQMYNQANPQPTNINVTLDGDAKKMLKVLKVENNKQIKATGTGAV